MTSLRSDGLMFRETSAPAAHSPAMKLRCSSAMMVVPCSVCWQKAAQREIAEQLADAESPRRCLVAGRDDILERAQPLRGDDNAVAQMVREPGARRVAVLGRREHGALKQHEAVGILMILVDRLCDEIGRIAAYFFHRATAGEMKPVFAEHVEREFAVSDVVQR